MRGKLKLPDRSDVVDFDTDDVKVTILDSGVLHIDTLSGVLKQWYAPGAWTWYAEEDFDGVDIDDVWARSGGAKDRFRRDG